MEKVTDLKSTRKADLVDAYMLQRRCQRSRRCGAYSEEEELEALKDQNVAMKSTALGVATEQMARAVTNNLSNLDTPTRKSLRDALEDFDEGDPDKTI